ncbi:MAG: Uma2 family endonuclease [Chitinophagia bacterium]|nr:Uma2 family endonuclease [Chitinophagia bacterium]
MQLADLDLDGYYTYADYLLWTFEERVELIKGKLFPMSAPNRIHQKLSGFLHTAIYNYLEGKQCEVYAAPFDVRIPRKTLENKDVSTVLQPDLCVICDPSKLDIKGCIGAPEIVVEILSPANNVTELKYKYEVYEEAGVLEYWVVSPEDKTFVQYVLANGKFVPSKQMVAGEVVHSVVLDSFSIDLAKMFAHIK